MKRIYTLLLTFLLLWPCVTAQKLLPKREFRGAWIQIINGQFEGMSRDQMQANLTHQLNVLQQCGINAIMFQVRGEADAMYASPYEPWSRFLTGRQGTAPNPYWDPLAWMITECHKRGMELHAWINPFRAKTKGTKELALNHPYVKHPERFFEYDGLYLFDPGLNENRRYICQIAADIVRRYDVDGIHMDDYFYPYPVAGMTIPDQATYITHKNGIDNVDDWRRYNVNLFIEMMHDSIRAVKPWVKFGVSPFGIYHNVQPGSNIPGSNTRGLQNYDNLYADVLYWINKGWVDYNIPQIYWEIGHKAADYEELIKWWSRFAGGRPLFIGQDVERTVRAADLKNPQRNQMSAKFGLQRSLRGIQGSCLWYSAAVVRNEGNYATALQKNYHRTPALQPLFPFIDDEAPGKPRKLKTMWMPNGYYLFWTAPKGTQEMDVARNYVVYRFEQGERIDLFNPEHIVAITPQTFYRLPYENGRKKAVYVVTALDRLQNESKTVKKKVKL
ncbi:MAG: family 10 glycosylhydrolase [Prevotellamassilia sp.]|nr:family 10 glycosylhydrolase [Prevotellamassilia sp.]